MSHSKWSEHATIRLIEVTKTRPSLWTKAAIQDDEPDEELDRIAEILNDFQPDYCQFSAAEVHAQIRYLTEGYLSIMEQMRCEISANLDVKPPKWKFFHYLSFLEQIFGDEKNFSMALVRYGNRGGEILGDLITLSETESEHELDEELPLENNAPLAQWDDEKKIRLIKEYESQPRLWCPTHPGFIKPMTHNGNQLRKEVLLEITAAMNVGEKVHFRHEQIRKMIGSIRQYYRACLRTGNSSHWPLYDNAKFLGNTVFEFVREKKDKENIPANPEGEARKRKSSTYGKKPKAEKKIKLKKTKELNLDRSNNSDSAYYLWSDDASMRLIEAYKAHPKLWCTNHPDYLRRKEHKKRSDEITEIVEHVNATLEKPFSKKQVRMQMNNFRRCYRNCLEMIEKSNEAISQETKEQKKLLQSIKPSDVEKIGTPTIERGTVDRKPTVMQKRIFLKRLLASKLRRHAPVAPTAEVKARILSLRLTYRKHYEEALRTGEEPKWRLYKHMKFLGSSVISLADRRKQVSQAMKAVTTYPKQQIQSPQFSLTQLTPKVLILTPRSRRRGCTGESQPIPECSTSPVRELTPAVETNQEPAECSPLLPVESIKRSLSFQEDSEDADELASTQSKRRRLINIEEHEETLVSRVEISRSPENVDSFSSSGCPHLEVSPSCFRPLLSTCQGPSFSSGALPGPSTQSTSTETPIACAKNTPEMDKCDRLGVIVASTLKRISTSNPSRLNESSK
uniref:MADF domain-containing protein n=1 Tax=Ditylenchus dipsaci TaxID=166011 RepID=A0A915ES27_9BILA